MEREQTSPAQERLIQLPTNWQCRMNPKKVGNTQLVLPGVPSEETPNAGRS